MENDSNLAQLKGLIAELHESEDKIIDKIKNLIKKNSDLEKEIKLLSESKYDLDARIRILETLDTDKIKHDLYKLESALHKFESQHDDRKQKWNMLFNFLFQLIWVAMAAWLLTKLGLQPPL